MGREEDVEPPEISRQTPGSDGIQASKTPARLADGLEVEGPPPPDRPAGYAPGEPLTRPLVPPLRAVKARIRLDRAYARNPSASKDHNSSGRRRNHSVRTPEEGMSTRALAPLLIIATLLLGAVGIFAQTSRPGDTLQLWEY